MLTSLQSLLLTDFSWGLISSTADLWILPSRWSSPARLKMSTSPDSLFPESLVVLSYATVVVRRTGCDSQKWWADLMSLSLVLNLSQRRLTKFLSGKECDRVSPTNELPLTSPRMADESRRASARNETKHIWIPRQMPRVDARRQRRPSRRLEEKRRTLLWNDEKRY